MQRSAKDIEQANGDVMTPFKSIEVEQVFERSPPAMRSRLLALRELIFEVAASIDDVGELEETLKWGEPAYVTSASRSGSAVRIDWKKAAPSQYCIYFHCKTNLVETFRTLFPKDFMFEGNRAIVFQPSETVPADALSICIAASLTYHRDKARSARPQPYGKVGRWILTERR
jgi:hypothetical protein